MGQPADGLGWVGSGHKNGPMDNSDLPISDGRLSSTAFVVDAAHPGLSGDGLSLYPRMDATSSVFVHHNARGISCLFISLIRRLSAAQTVLQFSAGRASPTKQQSCVFVNCCRGLLLISEYECHCICIFELATSCSPTNQRIRMCRSCLSVAYS